MTDSRLWITLMVMSACPSALLFAPRDVEARPNIVFIYTDDQAPTAAGFAGNEQLKTPHIDRIAREGATLVNAFVTTPVCSPSRAGLATSRYSSELGILDWINPRKEKELGLDPNLITWMELLQQSGYRTGLLGKWHLGTADRFHPTLAGYDVFSGFRDGGRPPQNAVLEIGGHDVKTEGFIVDVVTDLAIEFMNDRGDEPFLLSLHYREPHAAWLPTRDEDWEPYRELDVKLPEPDFPQLKVEEVKRKTREYYASVASVDRNVGRLLQALDDQGLSEETVVIFTSDHGYHLGHHGLWFKGNAQWQTSEYPPQRWESISPKQRPNLYDQALRVPTAVRWPGKIDAGCVVDETVSNLDWYPTLLAMADVAIPDGVVIRGHNMLPLLKGESITWDNDLYAEYSMRHGATTDMRAVRTSDWKLMLDFANEGRAELYDLRSDPDEKVNLASSSREDAQQARRDLTARIHAKLAELRDPAIVQSAGWAFGDSAETSVATLTEKSKETSAKAPAEKAGSSDTSSSTSPTRPPNVLFFLCDNLGYGDLACTGSTLHRTPHVDRLAAEGMTLTSFYVASGVCTPSRAAIMTGCYPRRVSMDESDRGTWVLQPVAKKGLHPQEVTMAEVLKSAGYATTCIGKWHLGDQPAFLPTRQGFDEYLGIPYSDDMTQREGKPWPPLPLLRGEAVIEAPVDRNELTRRYTEEAIRFMESHRDEPFFLYLPQAMPGSTRTPYASAAFRGKSANGPWGDSVEELDWSTGQLLDALKRLQLDDNTLFVWTSDNGAPRRKPPQGSNLPWKGWGYDVSEGSMRMPCFVRWPGKVPADSLCDELATAMDLLPTFARLAGTQPSPDRIIDGKDIWPLLSGHPQAKSPHEAFFYYFSTQLQAVRSGPWKLYLPSSGRIINGRKDRVPFSGALFNLDEDPKEENDRFDTEQAAVSRLSGLARKARRTLGDEEDPGREQRPAGWVDDPQPLVPTTPQK